ncbi:MULTISPECIES: DUF3231 family protein [unclassified Rossellomorea]|uniref:DUF3231 family protein n=1 Tax=unclassified Rossellomorea TaxID=2837526 RepID=UPI0020C6AC25|nr:MULTISPECIES: DUF3231 family protein [unclassified Rossellomorea]UTE75569.1 DUF3231 family protein [Rossellomorea sp. KS-H15a]WGG47746.1 DUF3231 family protein [Rossellomorea sp. DA94]
MEQQDIRLTTSEISALWTTYIKSSALNCFYTHFLTYLRDESIISLIEDSLKTNVETMREIEKLCVSEGFPIPSGFTEKDVDTSAPPLYTDIFVLSFVYRGGQVTSSHFTTIVSSVARSDVYDFFEKCLTKALSLYKRSLQLMLEKGIYDRPPKINYPKSIEYIDHQPSLLETWLGETRPLNALELSELFFVIERNCIGIILLKGFIQTSRDKEVKEYLKKGKKLSEKQITAFNNVLVKDDAFPTYPVSMEVTDSTIAPFSEKLMLFFISSSNSVGLSTLCHAITMSTRKDLAVHYMLFVTEIMKYGAAGLKLLVERGWMEQPPQQEDRKDLSK